MPDSQLSLESKMEPSVATCMYLGGKSRDAVIGTNNFPAYPQNKNSWAHAVRIQPVAVPLFLN